MLVKFDFMLAYKWLYFRTFSHTPTPRASELYYISMGSNRASKI